MGRPCSVRTGSTVASGMARLLAMPKSNTLAMKSWPRCLQRNTFAGLMSRCKIRALMCEPNGTPNLRHHQKGSRRVESTIAAQALSQRLANEELHGEIDEVFFAAGCDARSVFKDLHDVRASEALHRPRLAKKATDFGAAGIARGIYGLDDFDRELGVGLVVVSPINGTHTPTTHLVDDSVAAVDDLPGFDSVAVAHKDTRMIEVSGARLTRMFVRSKRQTVVMATWRCPRS